MTRPLALPLHLRDRGFVLKPESWQDHRYLASVFGPFISTVLTAMTVARKPGGNWTFLRPMSQAKWHQTAFELEFWAEQCEGTIAAVKLHRASQEDVIRVYNQGVEFLRFLRYVG